MKFTIIKKALFVIIILIGAGVSDVYAQGRITDFKALTTTNKYNQPVIEIKPLVFDPRQAENKELYKVYGVLICYKINGEPRAARQDMTRDIVQKGKYEYLLSISQSANITNISIEYFDATKPESTYPKKESCY